MGETISYGPSFEPDASGIRARHYICLKRMRNRHVESLIIEVRLVIEVTSETKIRRCAA